MTRQLPGTIRDRAVPIALLALLLVHPGPAAAQFGRAVAIAPATGGGSPEVLVLRPTAGRGEAALVVFRQAGPETWERSAFLRPVQPAAPYEGFSPFLAVAGDLVLAGAADAPGAWAGSIYQRGDGGWASAGRVPFSPGAGSEPPPASLSMPMLMGIMQPPSRVVAMDADGSLVAAWSQGAEASLVRIIERAPGGAWRPVASLASPDTLGFGGAVALAATEDRVAVGAPGRGPTGSVLLFRRTGGEWALEAELRAPDLAVGAGVGHALVLEADQLWAGAPGAGVVVPFRWRDGDWRAAPTIRALASDHPTADGSGRFGFAMAVDGDELWVGAPFEDEGRGAVHRFRRDGPDAWSRVGALRPVPEAGRAGAFGVDVALEDGIGVVGAPGAAGGIGGAAVYRRADGHWTVSAWLPGAPELESVAGGEVRCEDGTRRGLPAGAWICCRT